jgi:hypothetical protein
VRITTPSNEAYEVESIQGQRVHKGMKQYLVKWVGYTELTWTKEKDLACDELLEDWEIMYNLQQNKSN